MVHHPFTSFYYFRVGI